MILAGDPKQLPPTILSVNKRERNTKPKGPAPPKSSHSDLQPRGNEEISQSDGVDILEGDTTSESASDDGAIAPQLQSSERTPVTSNSQRNNKKATTARTRSLLRPPRSLETTLFDRLEKMYGAGIKRMLNVQYRYANQDDPF